MLSARRDRLALVTQLLVPIALVLVALWARQATDAFPQEPALDISRCAPLLLCYCIGQCGCMHGNALVTVQSFSRSVHTMGCQHCAACATAVSKPCSRPCSAVGCTICCCMCLMELVGFIMDKPSAATCDILACPECCQLRGGGLSKVFAMRAGMAA